MASSTTSSTPFQRCLITGASDPGSIGYAVAKAVIEVHVADAVVIASRDSDKVQTAVEQLQKTTKTSISGAIGDLSKPESMKAMLESIGGTIDLIIVSGCNGGSEYLGIDAATDYDGYHLLYTTSVVSPMALVTTAIQTHGTKSIVMVSSLASDISWPDTLPYNTAKAAQNALVKNLAFQYRSTARVNAVLPACIHSSKLDEMAAKKQTSVEDYAALRAAAHPLQKNGSVDQVAQAILSLATNGFLTGVLLPVDGGLSMTNWFNRPKLLAEYKGNIKLS